MSNKFIDYLSLKKVYRKNFVENIIKRVRHDIELTYKMNTIDYVFDYDYNDDMFHFLYNIRDIDNNIIFSNIFVIKLYVTLIFYNNLYDISQHRTHFRVFH
jgi:hypothetical protein